MKKLLIMCVCVTILGFVTVSAFAQDSDGDGIPDSLDNCPNTPNGTDLGTCVNFNDGTIGSSCTAYEQCTNGYCSKNQEDYDGDDVGDVCDADVAEDTYPSPGGNGCIDAWECEADFDGDGNVGANDVTTFLNDYGRNIYSNPCENDDLCNGDFDCDGNVASNDVTKFLEDFGRNIYSNPCPQDCQTGDWCVYPESSGCGFSSGFTTGERTIMSNGVERVYYLKLPASYDYNTTYPLVFGFHGTGGNYTSFTENTYYNLHGVVGEEAILVYPNALLNSNEVTQWNYDTDLIFFDDLFQELESNLCIDVWKVFTTGHSSGGGMSHFLGCERGDVLRAIGPVAGSLVDYLGCIGQVAVIQIQGSEDTIVPLGMVIPTRDYWVAINSCNSEETHVGVDPICVAYDDCDLNFPVQYCEHTGGHEWPDFAGDAIWDFFESLPLARPSSETGTGEIPNLVPGIISFKINYPSDFVGTPYKMALALYPPDTTQPLYTSPTHFLNPNVPVGDYQFGEIIEYNNVPINLYNVAFDDYTFTVTLYVEGGNYPIPTTGVDYVGLINITLDSDTITVVTPIDIEFLQSF